MTDLREQLLAAFLDEHKEYLEGLRALLARWEHGETPASSDLEEAFRLAHSLKAAAAVCDFGTIHQIGQRLESFFTRVRKAILKTDRDSLEVLKGALNAVEDWALGLAEKRAVAEPASALEALDQFLRDRGAASDGNGSPGRKQEDRRVARPEANASVIAADDDLTPQLRTAFQIEHREHLEGMRALLAQIEQGASGVEPIDEIFRRAHSLKGAARIAGLPPAETLAHRLETLLRAFAKGP